MLYVFVAHTTTANAVVADVVVALAFVVVVVTDGVVDSGLALLRSLAIGVVGGVVVLPFGT